MMHIARKIHSLYHHFVIVKNVWLPERKIVAIEIKSEEEKRCMEKRLQELIEKYKTFCYSLLDF